MAQIIGRIVQDAIVRKTKKREFISFTLVENYSYKNKAGEQIKEATFYDCAYWRSTALAPYLKKGMKILVVGRIKATAYTTKQGELKASLQLVAQDIQL